MPRLTLRMIQGIYWRRPDAQLDTVGSAPAVSNVLMDVPNVHLTPHAVHVCPETSFMIVEEGLAVAILVHSTLRLTTVTVVVLANSGTANASHVTLTGVILARRKVFARDAEPISPEDKVAVPARAPTTQITILVSFATRDNSFQPVFVKIAPLTVQIVWLPSVCVPLASIQASTCKMEDVLVIVLTTSWTTSRRYARSSLTVGEATTMMAKIIVWSALNIVKVVML